MEGSFFCVPPSALGRDGVETFNSLGFEAGTFREFVSALEATCATNASGLDPSLAKSLEMCMVPSWFVVHGCSAIAKSESGCGAGGPTADLVFCFVIAKILRAADDAISVRSADVFFFWPLFWGDEW